MNDCCDGENAFENCEPEKDYSDFEYPERNTNYIHFSSLTPAERQSFVDFQYKELNRHLDDIKAIQDDLDAIKERWGLEPRIVYVGKWLLVEGGHK